MTTDASITVVNIASTFGQRELYNPCVGYDHINTHRSTEDDPLPGGHFLFQGQVDTLLRMGTGQRPFQTRSIKVDPITEIKPPDTAVVGENQLRYSAEARVGIWKRDGGWLLIAWGTDDGTRAEHERMLERAEGTTEPLRWVGYARVAMYWSLSGSAYSSSVRFSTDAMECLGSELATSLQPRRVPSSYTAQEDLVHLWIPL